MAAAAAGGGGAPRRLRVGLVCPYSLDVPGGVQNHVRDLAVALRSRSHGVGVLAPGEDDGGLPEYVETVGRAVPIPYNGSVARLAFGPRVAARVRRWLADGRFDVVHVHEPAIPSVSLLALWAADVPVVATFHSAVVRSRAMTSAAALLQPALEKISARIAVSEAARDTLVRHYGGEPVILPNGLWVEGFARARRESELNRRGGPCPDGIGTGPTVVFLGRTDEPRKGLPVLLSAFPGIVGREPTARLIVAGRGDGEWLAELDSRVRPAVRFLGQVTDEERARLLASADVFVAPHVGGESFGIVLLEAMAAGAAVVASDLPAFRAVLDGGRLGVLVPVGDPGALARAVCDVLADPVGRSVVVGRAAREVSRYDWSRLVVEVEAVYETVTAGLAPSGSDAAIGGR
jgi:phosphatidyl-myo-inositol alpha-mannosyltransferase